jgi:hypothetical protein
MIARLWFIVKNFFAAVARKLKLKVILKVVGILLCILILITLVSYASIKVGCNTTLSEEALRETHISESDAAQEIKNQLPQYYRDEESTYLTFPEWYIVYSAHEYASVLETPHPSSFPYFRATAQFWCNYDAVNKITKQYGFNGDRQLMLSVIGVSFSGENIIKGIYENTVGRVSELLAFGHRTDEDIYAQKVADDYANFLHTIPWYEYPFSAKLKGLWTETSLFGPGFIRKAERKFILSLEYGVKAVYGGLLNKATRAIYEPAPESIFLEAQYVPQDISTLEPEVKIADTLDASRVILELPRYEAFTEVMKSLAHRGIQFTDIAGNDDIFFTVIAPEAWEFNRTDSYKLIEQPILTAKGFKRVGIRVPVPVISAVINDLEGQGVIIEHLYDY